MSRSNRILKTNVITVTIIIIIETMNITIFKILEMISKKRSKSTRKNFKESI